ncbi:endonuclease/exonuclease/phosphatase family protein [Streptomyces griseoluteus]|jgi:endonuclease/exonuclease/phosphatase family metal-dependent hydrolase|uniref:endonuclease/exonuclease/phosphatase family protein n=1 Tax=Streptomyces griseoluteus TaxID=29306 RepID=UPI0037000A5F
MPTPFPNSRTESDGSAVIRVLSYNVRSLRDDPEALARVVDACAPDVLLLQEAPRFFRWRKKLARLAKATGLVYLTGGAPAAGPAILCSLRATVESTGDSLLPLTPGQHRRGLATAVVRFGKARVGLVSCHLGLQKAERRTHSGLLLARLGELGVDHAVIGGDINEGPTGPAFTLLAEALQDAATVAPRGGTDTFPATAPARRIDAVLTTRGIEVLACGVPTDLPGVTGSDLRAATDHLPVLAALRIPASV